MKLVSVVLITLCWVWPARASIGPVTLDELVDDSPLILIGRVIEVTEIEEAPVAKVAVLQRLKGECPDEVYFLARGTWTCDISGAEQGEVALFFFGYYSFSEHPTPAPVPDEKGLVYLSSEFEERVGFREQVLALVGKGIFLQIADAGRGRMPIRTIDSVYYATLWTGDVRLPRLVSTIEGPEPGHDWIRSARLDELAAAIQTRVEQVAARPPN